MSVLPQTRQLKEEIRLRCRIFASDKEQVHKTLTHSQACSTFSEDCQLKIRASKGRKDHLAATKLIATNIEPNSITETKISTRTVNSALAEVLPHTQILRHIKSSVSCPGTLTICETKFLNECDTDKAFTTSAYHSKAHHYEPI